MTNQDALKELSDDELLKRLKKIRNYRVLDAFVVGMTIGITLFGILQGRYAFFTFFPLAIGYFIARNAKQKRSQETEILKEIASRKKA
ncbi:MAG TPA: hypothetical protein VK183_02140 [Flavobacterium sp.]|nr:hypothetical protein [Flavobacterium sp.]